MTKILIIEDRPEIRKLVTLAMRHSSHELIEVDNGEAGLQSARQERPDLVLLDVMMPGSMDGFAVCRAIKREPALSGTKVIMLTAMAQKADLERGAAAGADDYIVKPFSITALQQSIQKVLAPAEKS